MKKILVIGDVGQDIYYIGEATRLSPEAPVPILTNIREETRPAMAANVLMNIESLGGDYFLLPDLGGRSSTKIRVVAGNQQIVRLDKDPIDPLTFEEQCNMVEWIVGILDTFEIVILSDYGKGTLTERIIKKTIANAKCVLVDPHPSTNPDWYQGAYLIKSNLHNPHKYEAPVVIVTAGAAGMTVNDHGVEYTIGAKAQQVVDVTGAGDTVMAALGVALSQGKTIREAVEFANNAAAVVVKKFGTSTCSLAELA